MFYGLDPEVMVGVPDVL